MELRIEVTGTKAAPGVRLVGDHDAFFWLAAAAANASNGFADNEAVVAGGGKVELVPAQLASTQPKGSTAHLRADASGRR